MTARGEDVLAGLDHTIAARKNSKQHPCGYAKRHSSHTFLRMEVLFLCPGVGTCPCDSGSPEMYEGPLRDCPIHGKRGTEGER